MTTPPSTNAAPKWPHRVALCASILTWPLVFLGGLVTTYKVGMAVPDWPTTFGANMLLYDFMNAPPGVQLEHTHRLLGVAVGLACLVLCVVLVWKGPRPAIKALGVAALIGVSLQGLLGGLRVTRNSQVLAAVHGATGQYFFGLMVAIVVVTGSVWLGATTPRPDTLRLRRRTLATLGMLLVVVPLGAIVRHFGSHMAIGGHLLLALMVLGHAIALVVKIERSKVIVPELVPSSRALGASILLQFAAGVVALVLLWPLDPARVRFDALQVLVRTFHQANGALLLGAAIVMTLRAHRAFAPAAGRLEGIVPTSSRDLEVVA